MAGGDGDGEARGQHLGALDNALVNGVPDAQGAAPDAAQIPAGHHAGGQQQIGVAQPLAHQPGHLPVGYWLLLRQIGADQMDVAVQQSGGDDALQGTAPGVRRAGRLRLGSHRQDPPLLRQHGEVLQTSAAVKEPSACVIDLTHDVPSSSAAR